MSNSNEERRSWKEIAVDLIGERDRGRFRKLAEELDEVLTALDLERERHGSLLGSHRSQPLRITDKNACEKMVDVAVALMRSDYASLQMLLSGARKRRRIEAPVFSRIQPPSRDILGVGTRRLEKHMRNSAAR